MKTVYTLFLLSLLLCVSACYEDKGNYDYLPYYEVNVEVENNYGVKKPETPIDFTITPKVTRSDGSDDLSNISYVWYYNTRSNQQRGDTLSTEQSATIHLDPTADNFAYNYYMRLYVTDNLSGVTRMYPVNLKVVKPYEFSWLVLHDTDNHAEIGSVEYAAGEIIITPDALTQERGDLAQPLKGKAVSLGRRQCSTYIPSYWGGLDNNTQVYVNTTDADESGLLNQHGHFLLLANWEKMIYPIDFGGFKVDEVKMANGYNGVLTACNGHAFQGSGYSFLMYGIEPDDEIAMAGDSYIEAIAAGPSCGLAFDSRNHRFLMIDTQANAWMGSNHNPADERAKFHTVKASPQNAADPSKISEDKQFVDFVGGYWYAKTATAAWQRIAINAYMLSPTTGKSYVYIFHSYPLSSSNDPDDIPLAEMYTIDTPSGVTTETPMTSSWEYNNILFYAVDNKIYKLDYAMTGGSSTLIYQHPDPAAKISCLQMAFEEYTDMYQTNDGTTDYGHPYMRTMAAGVNLSDGTGSVVVLQLSTAGRIDSDSTYPAVQEHTGFGPIKDITFIN